MRIFFLHIPKCAGTTLHHIIEQQYSPEQVYTVPSVAWNGRNFWALREEWDELDRHRLAVVKGHMLFGWHYAFPWPDNEYTYITLLREPKERVASLYRFVKSSGGGHYLSGMIESNLEGFFQASGNEMTRMLAGMPRILPIDGDYALAYAKAHLAEDFSVIGFVDQFDHTVESMNMEFGWRSVPYEPLNVTDHSIPFDGWEIAQRYNQLDIELYEWAREKYL